MANGHECRMESLLRQQRDGYCKYTFIFLFFYFLFFFGKCVEETNVLIGLLAGLLGNSSDTQVSIRFLWSSHKVDYSGIHTTRIGLHFKGWVAGTLSGKTAVLANKYIFRSTN